MLPPCPFGERKFCEIKLHETRYLMGVLFCLGFFRSCCFGLFGNFFETNRVKCSLLEAQKKFVCTI